MEILQRIDANMDADEEAEMAAAELEAELEAEREAEEAEDEEGDMPQYMEDEGEFRIPCHMYFANLYVDDDGGEMDEDDEDEQMFLGFAGHSRHLPFGWEGDIDSPVIVSRGHNRYVLFCRISLQPNFSSAWCHRPCGLCATSPAIHEFHRHLL